MTAKRLPITSGGPRRDAPVVDAHVHAFPPEFIADRERLTDHDFWFGQLYRDPRAKLTNDATLLASMEWSGIGQSVICGFPWSDMGRCRAHNDWMADICQNSDDTLAWLGIVVPHHPEAGTEARRCFELGASGIGELNADAQGFTLDHPNVMRLLIQECIAQRKPVLMHASEPVGHRYPGKGTATPEHLLTFITAFQELDLVLAHWGGGLAFYTLMPEVGDVCTRVSYDSAASSYLYDHAIFRHMIAVVGHERILWGSDFPVLGQQRFLNHVRHLDLECTAEQAVMGLNAARIYGLPTVTNLRSER